MKKGFTLIELLSVIVILAIISVIAVPTLIGVVNKAKLNALKSSAYGLIEASNLYYAQNGSNNYRFDIEGSNVASNDTDKLLSFKGNVKNGVSIIKTNGKTVICVTDGKNSAYKNYNEEKVNLISGKVCTIPTNTSIVYLDGETTLSELSNQELTDKIAELEEKINSLKPSVDDMYPIGSYYITENESNPSTLFGGTWEKVEGRFLLGSSENYTLGSTGGNTSVSYTPEGIVGDHTLTVAEMPSHNHSTSQFLANTSGISELAGGSRFDLRSGTGYTGGNQPHNHPFAGTTTSIQTMPPYIVVNVWKRTA